MRTPPGASTWSACLQVFTWLAPSCHVGLSSSVTPQRGLPSTSSVTQRFHALPHHLTALLTLRHSYLFSPPKGELLRAGPCQPSARLCLQCKACSTCSVFIEYWISCPDANVLFIGYILHIKDLPEHYWYQAEPCGALLCSRPFCVPHILQETAFIQPP